MCTVYVCVVFVHACVLVYRSTSSNRTALSLSVGIRHITVIPNHYVEWTCMMKKVIVTVNKKTLILTESVGACAHSP